jgi:hypothetical protein
MEQNHRIGGLKENNKGKDFVNVLNDDRMNA